MKKLWRFIRDHVREDFNAGHYLTVAAILVIALLANYTIDYVDNVLEPMTSIRKFFLYLAFYSVPYFLSIFSYCYFYGRSEILTSKSFWLKAVLAIVIISADGSLSLTYPLISALSHPLTELWMIKFFVNVFSIFTIVLPVYLLWLWTERADKTIYGLRPRSFDAKPYVAMLVIMIPLIFLASFNGSFQRQYPMYKLSLAHAFFGVPEWLTVAGYEFAYGFDFVTVEYFFRGLLVIGMASFLNRGAVLTMTVMYCCLHFGKPAAEAISSIFGGYILGVVAYETRSIWGGVIVHIGIAWTMELAAYLQKLADA